MACTAASTQGVNQLNQDLRTFKTLANILDSYTLNNNLQENLEKLGEQDWSDLAELASQHGVSPRFYQTVKALAKTEPFPADLHTRLKNAYLQNAVRNTLLLARATKLLQDFNSNNIDTIALKGIYLVENINHTIGERYFCDIDLLVKRADLPKAIARAQECGFNPSTYFDPADQDIDIKHVPPMFNHEGLPLEIHWTLLEEDEPFNIDAAELWQRAIPAKVAGVDVLALSPEDFAAHLCLHFTYQHHLSLGMKGLLDVADVLRHFQDQFDWDRFLSIVSSWQCQRVAWLTLSLVREFSMVNIPDEVIHTLQPVGIETWVIQQARTQIIYHNSIRAGVTPDLAEFSKANSFFSKLKIGMSRVFLPRKVIARLYNLRPNSPEILKGYFFRVKDLFRVYGNRVWNTAPQSLQWKNVVAQEQERMKLCAWMGGKG